MRRLQLLLTTLGLLDSGYLLYTNFQPYCPLETCEIVVFPFPAYLPALLGFLWFASAIPTLHLAKNFTLILWRSTGIAGIAFFATLSFIYHYFCPYCIAAYLIGALLIVSTLR